MKNFRVQFLSIVLLFLSTSHVFAKTDSGQIVITIKGIDQTSGGNLLLALHDSKKTFLKKSQPFRRAIVPVEQSQIEYVFQDIPFGIYSIAVFQDENKNMDLDLGKMFRPKEKYGFSNNARGKFGPPGFQKTTFELKDSQINLEIEIDL